MLNIERTLKGLRGMRDELAGHGERLVIKESRQSDRVADVTIPRCDIKAAVDPHGVIHWRDSGIRVGVGQYGRCGVAEFRVRVTRNLADHYRERAKAKRDGWRDLCDGGDVDMPRNLADVVDGFDARAAELDALTADEPPLLDRRDYDRLRDFDGELSDYEVADFEAEGIIRRDGDRFELTEKGEKALEYASHVDEWRREEWE